VTYLAQGDAVVYLRAEPDAAPIPPETRARLDSLAEAVLRAPAMEDVLAGIWKSTQGLIPRDRIGLSLIDRDGVRVTAKAVIADYDGVRLGKGYSSALAGSSLEELADSGGVRVIPDLEFYLASNPDSASTRIILKEGVRSSLTVPLSVRGRPVGFLFFSCREPLAYDENHAGLLLEVRERISLTVEKLWLIDSLDDINRSYMHTLEFVSHEMKSPLANMTFRGKAYIDGFFGPPDPKGKETVKGMLDMVEYLRGMVEDYIDLCRVERGAMRFEPKDGVKLDRIAHFAADAHAMEAKRREARVETDAPEGGLPVRGDAKLLGIVLSNLVGNALKYGRNGQTVRMRLAGEAAWTRITVRNEGVGFTEAQGKKLFRRFSRLRQEGVEREKGSGLGLYLCWWIVQKHGGRMSARSEPGQWAEFTVLLPKGVPPPAGEA